MKILLVEDSPTYLLSLSEDLQASIPGLEIVTASSSERANNEITNNTFDLIICDLKIPSRDDDIDAEIAHGLSVVANSRNSCNGIPVFVLSAFADDVWEELTLDMVHEDLFGSGNSLPMLRLTPKRNTHKCIEAVVEFSRELMSLENIHIQTHGSIDLEIENERVLRIFSRRNQGVNIEVSEIRGGLSKLSVLRVELNNSSGGICARAIAKIGPLDTVKDEHQRYETHVPQLLNPSTYAHPFHTVTAGARKIGGLFYALAEGDVTLYQLIQNDAAQAANVVETLRGNTAPWLDHAPRGMVSIGSIRRQFLTEQELDEVHEPLDTFDWRRFEEREVWVSNAAQHGDLHPGNVIIRDDGSPILVDFGHTGIYSPVVDPLALEFGLIFHPTGREISHPWPSNEQIANWSDIEVFVDGCPFPDYLRQCRNWASDVAQTPRELFAFAYAIAFRQLKFPNIDYSYAKSIATSAALAIENL